MKTVTDQLNRTLSLDRIPKRIVSLVPSQTELLYDLGLDDAIVGITKFCVHPPHFKKTKAVVGGTKQVRISAIKALKPDIILCNKEENTPGMIRDLEKIAPVHISAIYTVADCLELISLYGQLFSRPAAAAGITTAIREEQDELARFLKDKPKINAAYFIWKNPWMVAAKNTFINAILSLNKFRNCYGHLNRYPEIDPSVSPPQRPDIVLLPGEPYPFKEKHKEELQPFFPGARIFLVDGEMFSWYGSRLIKAFSYFKTLHQTI